MKCDTDMTAFKCTSLKTLKTACFENTNDSISKKFANNILFLQSSRGKQSLNFDSFFLGSKAPWITKREQEERSQQCVVTTDKREGKPQVKQTRERKEVRRSTRASPTTGRASLWYKGSTTQYQKDNALTSCQHSSYSYCAL